MSSKSKKTNKSKLLVTDEEAKESIIQTPIEDNDKEVITDKPKTISVTEFLSKIKR